MRASFYLDYASCSGCMYHLLVHMMICFCTAVYLNQFPSRKLLKAATGLDLGEKKYGVPKNKISRRKMCEKR